MNNEKLPPARMEIQIIVDEKQAIKFAWPNTGFFSFNLLEEVTEFES